MPKVVYRVGEREFHCSFGAHPFVPKKNVRLNVDEIDALVLEDNLHLSPQARGTVEEALRKKKPVYYVENPVLRHIAGMKNESSHRITSYVGAISAFVTNGLLYNPGREFNLKEETLHFLISLGVGAASGGVYNWKKTRSAIIAPKLPKKYSQERWKKLPADVRNDLLIAQRNAVIAEGLLRLNQYSRIGLIAGSGHYNIPNYLEDEELRTVTRNDFEPDIRRIKTMHHYIYYKANLKYAKEHPEKENY